MTDEKKIEEAAAKYAERYFGLPKSLQLGSHCFKMGINWFKKNLWHDAKEQPKIDELLIVQYIKDRRVKYMTYMWDSLGNCSWAENVIDFHITKWCYLKDLI